jgi:hypothetical protein
VPQSGEANAPARIHGRIHHHEGGDRSSEDAAPSNGVYSPQTPNSTFHQPIKPIFMVPFDRDETFVGRQDILDNIHQKVNDSRRRAVLTGIG